MKEGDTPIITKKLYDKEDGEIDLEDVDINYILINDVSKEEYTIECDITENNEVTYQMDSEIPAGMYRTYFVLEFEDQKYTIPEHGAYWIYIQGV